MRCVINNRTTRGRGEEGVKGTVRAKETEKSRVEPKRTEASLDSIYAVQGHRTATNSLGKISFFPLIIVFNNI